MRYQAFLQALGVAQEKSAEKDFNARRDAWEKVLEALEMEREAFVSQIAPALHVEKVTVRRWLDGTTAPRLVTFHLIRDFFREYAPDEDTASQTDVPARFGSTDISVWSFEHWSKLMENADAAFVCRGKTKFQGVTNPDTLRKLEKITSINQSLVVYYVTVENSEAYKSFDKAIDSFSNGYLQKVRKISLKENEDFLGLTGAYGGFVSLVIFKMKRPQGSEPSEFLPFVILLEIPVEQIDRLGRVINAQTLAYVQLPASLSQDIWMDDWAQKLLEIGAYSSFEEREADGAIVETEGKEFLDQDKIAHFGLRLVQKKDKTH